MTQYDVEAVPNGPRGRGNAARQTATRLPPGLYAQRYLVDHGPLRGIDAEGDEAIERFDELVDGTLVID